MTKPTITTRAGKGSALTWTEGDTNLTNLRDATISVTDGTTTAALDLNDTLTLTAGSGISVAVNASTKTATITNTQTAGATTLDGLSDVVLGTPAAGEVLYFDGTNWVDQAASGLTVSSASTATTATNANNINISTNTGNSNDTTLYPVLVGASTTGNQLPHIDSVFTYNASTDTLTATNFSGTATNATNINIASTDGNTNDTFLALVFVPNSATGNQAPHTDTGISYNASTNVLTTTTFSGALSGAVNGTVGATTPNTGIFTGLTAKGTTNTAKLTVDSTALSSTAWGANGIGLKVQSATYTDTSSVAGTVALSHVHVIGAPTLASTNAITVTDAASLYIPSGPINGTNTTITNSWALYAAGRIRGTSVDSTPIGLNSTSSGAFTTLSASSTVSGTGFSNYLASPPAIGSTTASTGAFTTLSASTTTTSGALNVTYNPASASGAAIQATGKDSQGGVGYFDFLKTTNTTSGATNANKTFRTNSTGALEIINSGYTSTILSLTDAGAMTVPSLTVSTSATLKDIRETVYAIGNSGTATLTPDAANGTIQTITATGNFTLSAFANPVSGQSITFIITQDATGSRTLTSTMKFSGGTKTLSTAANSIDILTVSYIGTTYYASLAKGFA